MQRIRANNTIKHEELLEANLEAMYKVVLSFCKLVLKDQVCYLKDYEDIDNNQDTLGVLRCIKKIIYSNGDDDTHMGYNHVVVITNYYKYSRKDFNQYKTIATNLLLQEGM